MLMNIQYTIYLSILDRTIITIHILLYIILMYFDSYVVLTDFDLLFFTYQVVGCTRAVIRSALKLHSV